MEYLTSLRNNLTPDQFYNLLSVVQTVDLPKEEIISYIDDVINNKKNLIRGNPAFEPQRQFYDKQNRAQTDELNIQPNEAIKCSKCNNNKTVRKSGFTRAADEAMTIEYQCVKCGHSWHAQ